MQEFSFDRELVRLQRYVYTCALNGVHDPDVAQDVAQDAMTIAVKYRDSFKPELPMKNWLAAIVRNCVRSRRRHYAIRQRHTEKYGSMPYHDSVSGGQHERLELLDALNVLNRLPEAQREAVSAALLSREKQTEAARRMGVSTVTLRTRLERGRRRIAEAVN